MKMIHIQRQNFGRYRPVWLFLCFITISTVCIYTFNINDMQQSINSLRTFDNEVVDRQDQWRYQNSITGEWYHWRTVYKKQDNTVEWRVKWLNIVPTSYLGVIVYLARIKELKELKLSLTQLSRLLLNNPRPIVIFHEGDFESNDTQQSLAQTVGSRTPLAFERVHFVNSSNQPPSVHHDIHQGYFDMCRFYTLMLPTHPLLTLFTYYWRLDTHSYLFGPKSFEDPFEIMQKRQLQYAFAMVNEEGTPYIPGLWSFFNQFLNYHHLTPSQAVYQTQTDKFGNYSLALIFTNFAIANVSLFRDHPLVRSWVDATDRNGGIYRYRWGDAPIHTLILTQLLERNQIVRMRQFGYVHRHEYACASGIEQDLCTKQAQPFILDPKAPYLYYEDGCYPSARNLLCHYYPEIEL